MGLLTPIYVLAALTIVGPVIFHLIRRQPQGQMQFSSLMFLSPSPPQLTRRSRLDNLLLLLLRALAIVLITLAFARPYLRQQSLLGGALSGRNIVILLDTSASMQRADVWQAAQQELTDLLDSLGSGDHVALYTVDRQLSTIVPLDNEEVIDSAATQQTVRAAIGELKPTWYRTELAQGLKAVADTVSAATISGRIDPAAESRIVLISDLHVGSELEPLQGYPWPESIGLDVRRILPQTPGNARPSLIFAQEGDAQKGNEESGNGYRVRIENNEDSARQAFQLAWGDSNGPIAAQSTTVQVPAGQVRVIPVAPRPSGSDRIVLMGDAWQADNEVYVADVVSTWERIAFVGPRPSRPEEDLSYFLKQAPLSTQITRREVSVIEPHELPGTAGNSEVQAIVLEPMAELGAHAEALRAFADQGGVVIVCLARPSGDANLQRGLLEQLWDIEGVRVTEAETEDFALLSSIDFRHPVFAPFADPRFNDFSKIRFWSHRRVELPEDDSLRVVASFDDETPMLVQQSVGQGSIWMLASGWQPEGSGLGLSSKFVPILFGMLDPTGRSRQMQLTYEVGEEIDVHEFSDLKILDMSGIEALHSPIEAGRVRLMKPGLYWLESDDLRRQIAIQVPASESQLRSLDVDVLEQYGVALGKVVSDAERREATRQLQVEELESRQRLWQWAIVAGIVVLAVETLWAGYLARKNARGLLATS